MKSGKVSKGEGMNEVDGSLILRYGIIMNREKETASKSPARPLGGLAARGVPPAGMVSTNSGPAVMYTMSKKRPESKEESVITSLLPAISIG